MTPSPSRLQVGPILVLAVLLASSGFALPPQPAARSRADEHPPIVIDGQFDDWRDVDMTAPDTAQIGVAQGPKFLYLHFRQPAATILQSGASDIVLLLDTDGDANTGRPIFGLGADLEWDFRARSGKIWSAGGAQPIGPAHVGLVIAPTVGSRRVEIAIDLPAARGALPGLQNKLRGAITDVAGGLGFGTQHTPFKYRVGSYEVAATASLDPQRGTAENLRVMNYNIERDGLFAASRQAAYRRVFRTLEPDIVGFQEIFQFPVEAAGARLDDWVPVGGGALWHTAAAGTDAGLASRYPIDSAWLITPGVDAYLVDTRAVLGSRIVVIVVSLKCCEDLEGLRKVQIDAILSFWRDAMSAGGTVTVPDGTPMLMIGDMNLVGDPAEVTALREGIPFNPATGPRFAPDWNGKALVDLRPLHTDQPMAYTWRRDGNSGGFAPGRLDYIFATQSVLRIEKRFVLHTRSMTKKRLKAFGLRRRDTTTASDHLPLVTDVRRKKDRR
jgi:endonuclease/exonuclease/phosphatase family metal-dependent hydrolase